jgi:hypothetical protein
MRIKLAPEPMYAAQPEGQLMSGSILSFGRERSKECSGSEIPFFFIVFFVLLEVCSRRLYTFSITQRAIRRRKTAGNVTRSSPWGDITDEFHRSKGPELVPCAY